MSRISALLITVAAVALLAIGILLLFQDSEPSTPSDTPAPAAIVVATSTIAESSNTYSIDLKYPKFGVDAMDARVQGLVDTAVSEFKALPPPVPEAAANKNELIGAFDSVYVGADLVSAKMEIYQFTGGAHGLTVAYGLNFRHDGTAITLNDALALTGKTLHEVAEEAERKLTERFEMVQFPEGAMPTPENYATFYITKDAVVFVFQQYQVEAYAAGMPEIRIPRVR